MQNAHIPIFALLTDFGFDYAVASMKGVITQTFPVAQIIDVDHSLKKFAIISAAFIIQKSACYFAKDTIFICIVDPGVGSIRNMLCVQLGEQWFVGPDNGIFHYLFKDQSVKVYRIIQDFFEGCSRTFHGRDLFTPAAVKLAQGNCSFLMPFDLQQVVLLNQLDQQAMITYIDSFGNIKTNIEIRAEPQRGALVSLDINGRLYTVGWQTIFVDVPEGTPLCYRGSNNTLEIAVNGGSAQHYFGVDVGACINSWHINGT
jgi:S-adenosyl-L-methionine hydrolase (adenosine-forming)